MPDALSQMLEKYEIRAFDDAHQALREIIQEVALLGLWRAKFYEKAAFYGGTALRVLHGLGRFSEDLDFSLLKPDADFDFSPFLGQLEKEVEAFGFSLKAEIVRKKTESAIRSVFLKGDTEKQMLLIRLGANILDRIPRGQIVKVKLEVDIDPPGGFTTETRYLLLPIPFGVRTFALPDLFAGKMHAVLCRRSRDEPSARHSPVAFNHGRVRRKRTPGQARGPGRQWGNRVKGRDWYDFVWFAGRHPELKLSHLEQRMRQTGHWTGEKALEKEEFLRLLEEAINKLDVGQAKREVLPFVRRPEEIEVWSAEFFLDIAGRIVPVE